MSKAASNLTQSGSELTDTTDIHANPIVLVDAHASVYSSMITNYMQLTPRAQKKQSRVLTVPYVFLKDV